MSEPLVYCPRCSAGSREPLWDLSLPEQQGTKSTWFELCAECYRTVFGREPPEQITRENLKKIWRRRSLI
jgi:hypothetical protein